MQQLLILLQQLICDQYAKQPFHMDDHSRLHLPLLTQLFTMANASSVRGTLNETLRTSMNIWWGSTNTYKHPWSPMNIYKAHETASKYFKQLQTTSDDFLPLCTSPTTTPYSLMMAPKLWNTTRTHLEIVEQQLMHPWQCSLPQSRIHMQTGLYYFITWFLVHSCTLAGKHLRLFSLVFPCKVCSIPCIVSFI